MDKSKKITVIIFSASLLVLAGMLWMPMLSGPDGLEQVMFDLTGNDEWEPESEFEFDSALLPDYEFLGIENGYFHSWLVGLIGATITFIIMFGLMKVIIVKRNVNYDKKEFSLK